MSSLTCVVLTNYLSLIYNLHFSIAESLIFQLNKEQKNHLNHQAAIKFQKMKQPHDCNTVTEERCNSSVFVRQSCRTLCKHCPGVDFRKFSHVFSYNMVIQRKKTLSFKIAKDNLNQSWMRVRAKIWYPDVCCFYGYPNKRNSNDHVMSFLFYYLLCFLGQLKNR